jgi:uncharacterized membrane protein
MWWLFLGGLALVFGFQWSLSSRLAKIEREMVRWRYAPPAAGLPGSADPPPNPAASPPSVPVRETMAALFERYVGGRLLIWIGGIALAVAGGFLVRYSIEIGLVTPELRMIAAALLGAALLAAGESARATRLLADDPRVAQALVGSGIAILYATAYGSYFLYGLFGAGTATALMLLITAVALGLSLRHGAPTAALGLAGGFLTPALVGDPDAGAVPLLLYLALLDAALFFIAWRRGWTWLAAAALLASFAWTGALLFWPAPDATAAGLFIVALALLSTAPKRAAGGQLSWIQPLIIALVELAVLVGRTDLEPLAWLLFGVVAAASFPLAVARPATRFAVPVGVALTLLLLLLKATTGENAFAATAAIAATLLFGGGAMALAARRDSSAILASWTGCAGLAGPLLVMRGARPELLSSSAWGGLALVLGAACVLLLWILRQARGRDVPDWAAFAAAGTAALLAATAAYGLLPQDFVSGGWLAAAVALLLAGVRLPDKALRLAGLGLLTATILKVFVIDAAALEGALRILSFLALGLALIGIGKLYTRVLAAEAGDGARQAEPAADASR